MRLGLKSQDWHENGWFEVKLKERFGNSAIVTFMTPDKLDGTENDARFKKGFSDYITHGAADKYDPLSKKMISELQESDVIDIVSYRKEGAPEPDAATQEVLNKFKKVTYIYNEEKAKAEGSSKVVLADGQEIEFTRKVTHEIPTYKIEHDESDNVVHVLVSKEADLNLSGAEKVVGEFKGKDVVQVKHSYKALKNLYEYTSIQRAGELFKLELEAKEKGWSRDEYMEKQDAFLEKWSNRLSEIRGKISEVNEDEEVEARSPNAVKSSISSIRAKAFGSQQNENKLKI